MRLLVLTMASAWTPGDQLLVALGAELAAHGDVVTIACPSGGAVERAVVDAFPRLPVRAVTGAGTFARVRSLRGIVRALRPDAVLVEGASDALLAAFAVGRGGRVVRRVPVALGPAGRARDADGWRSRLAAGYATVTSWGRETLSVSWPPPADGSRRGDGDAATVPTEHARGTRAAALWIVPPDEHDEHTAIALRAAARLVGRHPSLRIMLLGDVARLQSTRVHAASLGLTAFVDVLPLDALLHADRVTASAVWVTAGGDAGAIATLAAMQHGVPVIVPPALPSAAMVAARITGFVPDEADLAPTIADVARLLSDEHERHLMGSAARTRALRLYGWEAYVAAARGVLAGSGARREVTP